MRKFLGGLCLSVFSLLATAAEDPPLIAGLKAFGAPMQALAGEAAKGRQANFDVVDQALPAAEAAWKTAMTDALDVDSYGVPAAQHEETRRNVRLLDMLVGHMGDAYRRGDRSLVLRAAERLPEPYGKLKTTLGLH